MKRHDQLLTLFIAVTAMVSLGSLIFFSINKIIAPDADMVAVVHFLSGGGSGNEINWLSLDILKFRDNEHRPYFPMIIWGIDRDLFNFSGHFPQAVSFLFILLISYFSTNWASRREWSKSARRLVFLSACCLMLSPMHWTNLIWEKQVHVYASIFFAILAFVTFEHAISAGPGRKRYLTVFSTNLCAFVSTFSFAYGLIAWPVLLAYGIWRKLPFRLLLLILVSSLITIGLYFSTYEVLGHHSDPLESLRAIGGLAKYSLLFLGGPFVAVGFDDWVALLLAAGSLLIIAWALWRVRLLDHKATSAHGASLMISFFCIGVALLTGLGRLTINTGAESRYLVIAALYLLAVSALLVPWIEAKRLNTPFVWLFMSICLGLNVVMHFDYSDIRHRQLLIREGVIAAAMNTKPLYRGLFPAEAVVNQHVWPYFFQRNRESKSLQPLNWLGQTLPHASRPAQSADCIGAVAAIRLRSSEPGYVTASGWARWGHRGERSSAWILITDDELRVVGMGTSGVKRHDVRKVLPINIAEDLFTDSKRAGFIGQAKAKPGGRLSFYAYRDSQVCQFAENVSVPAS